MQDYRGPIKFRVVVESFSQYQSPFNLHDNYQSSLICVWSGKPAKHRSCQWFVTIHLSRTESCWWVHTSTLCWPLCSLFGEKVEHEDFSVNVGYHNGDDSKTEEVGGNQGKAESVWPTVADVTGCGSREGVPVPKHSICIIWSPRSILACLPHVTHAFM